MILIFRHRWGSTVDGSNRSTSGEKTRELGPQHVILVVIGSLSKPLRNSYTTSTLTHSPFKFSNCALHCSRDYRRLSHVSPTRISRGSPHPQDLCFSNARGPSRGELQESPTAWPQGRPGVIFVNIRARVSVFSRVMEISNPKPERQDLCRGSGLG